MNSRVLAVQATSIKKQLANKKFKPKLCQPISSTPQRSTSSTNRTPTPTSNRRQIPSALRKTILHQAAHCEFKDPQTEKLCGSQRFLQIDHIVPVWAGGTNDPKNLRTLCADHNQFKYLQEAGFHP